MKLWQKDKTALKEVDRFTVGKDRDMDLYLAAFDVQGSLAHCRMLEKVKLLSAQESNDLQAELKNIYKQILKGHFSLEENVEDVHSQVEILLTQKLGDTGKKIHAARSRNDQVLVDLKLFLRHELELLVNKAGSVFELLQAQSEKFKSHLLPGYTHLQLAMPSSFGLWFGAYAESMTDDLVTIKAAYDIVNRNPLGSAAGYGSSFPIDRKMTAELLGFEGLNYNVVYAQMGRGKSERIVAQALSNLADTLGRLSMDATLFLNQNFGFIEFPEELTTGSSIIPHKKNQDVFELIRAHCNKIKALPNEISLMTTNLPSGYHRDLQLLKESLFPAFKTMSDCLEMTGLMLSSISVNENILGDEKYKFLFSVEEVNKLVNAGMPFRDAYKKIGKDIAEGKFNYSTDLHHTHEGSIGNLCTADIKRQWERIYYSFPFEKVNKAIETLVS